jgi:TonB family protein
MGVPLQTTECEVSESSAPALLPHWEPGFLTFRQNFADIFRKRPAKFELSVAPGAFWTDVFVSNRFPWARFALSGTLHLLAIAVLFATGRFWSVTDRVYERASLGQRDVIYFSPSDYLPALDSGADTSLPSRGEPVPAPQPILSVPANPDNRTQTIVTPPDVKLDHDVPVPNVVAWKQSQPLPAVPISAAQRPLNQNPGVVLQPSVVEPAPSLASGFSKPTMPFAAQAIGPAPSVESATRINNAPALETAAVGPPPTMAEGITRAGAMIIGSSDVVAPAPTVTASGRAQAAGLMSGMQPVAVAPAPSASGIQGATTSGRLIALGIHPSSLNTPITPPAGNRRGAFEAGPNGKPGASGSPTVQAGPRTGAGLSGSGSSSGIPAGLRVGPASGATSAAGARAGDTQTAALRTSETTRVVGHASEVSDEKATEVDRQVFGSRKFYSMSLNMPNLNSTGGSWVIRFAELAGNNDHGELVAPEATQKVDPAYPLALMRENVQGTVTVRAIIHRDGSVGDVQVVRSIDERLDLYACKAFARWHFQPALKNGLPVDLQAVVLIPFRPSRLKSGF